MLKGMSEIFSFHNSINLPHTHLVLASRSLASLQLVQIPSANLHVSILLIHARSELLGRTRAVVAPGAVLCLGRGSCRGGGLLDGVVGGCGTTAEETADCVAD